MKISLELDDNRSIIGINNTNENAAEAQSKYDGWTLVESDPAFSIDNMYLWTVRDSDNILVHSATNMTPAEESQQNFTALTMQNLATSKSVKEVQSGVTALTQAQLADAQDKADLKNGMTELTKQFAAMQLQLATSTKTTEAE
ncbi:hypothetical protein [Companilactobacillus jidongensis]|uniref:hypothetical protein n=1 Tax=Companilactobacillus jidongensis TaxID=2486006 RepID=UPI000F780DBB|nr:hypothetical protein [Companilactobacillus jidongensis]